MTSHFLPLAAVFALCLAGPAAAQALRYTSAFDGYEPYQAPVRGDWRVVNEQVRPAAACAPPMPAMPASSAAPPQHGAHHANPPGGAARQRGGHDVAPAGGHGRCPDGFGCASFSHDAGFGVVQQLTRERTGQAPELQRSGEAGAALQARIDEQLRVPLAADSAVALALPNHRGLQSRFAELGIAEADFVSVGRLRNPSFTFGRSRGADGVDIDRPVMFDLLALPTMPMVRQLGQARFEQAQLQAAFEAVGVADAARQAFFHAVAAQAMVAYYRQVGLR